MEENKIKESLKQNEKQAEADELEAAQKQLEAVESRVPNYFKK